MQEEMRDQLEAGAKKRNWTVTEELLWRLRGSFAREDEEKRDPVARALCYLISQIAEGAHAGLPASNWHCSPFIFRVFKLGVAELLDSFERAFAEGKPDVPLADFFPPGNPFRELYNRTPENVATVISTHLLTALYYFQPKMLTQELREGVKDATETLPDQLRSKVLEELDDSFYSMVHVRRDLGIEGSMEGMEGIRRAWERARETASRTDEPKGDKS